MLAASFLNARSRFLLCAKIEGLVSEGVEALLSIWGELGDGLVNGLRLLRDVRLYSGRGGLRCICRCLRLTCRLLPLYGLRRVR